MTYRELVQRAIATRHSSLELGLSKAREQEPFIHAVAACLDKTSWQYRVSIDAMFNVTFTVDVGLVAFEHQYQAVKQALSAQFDVECGVGSELLLHSRYPLGLSCKLVFDDGAA